MSVFRERGKSWAFGVKEKVTPLIKKFRLPRALNCVSVRRRRPVLSSRTAPVAFSYALNALEAKRTRVVPVSTIPAVLARMLLVPKVIDSLMPQNSLAGEVLVIDVNVMLPLNLEESVPPKVSSPLVTSSTVVGSKETATKLSGMVPCENKFPVTVATVVVPETVSSVKSSGPIPMIPSTPSKPVDVEATPMDWFLMTKLEEIVT